VLVPLWPSPGARLQRAAASVLDSGKCWKVVNVQLPPISLGYLHRAAPAAWTLAAIKGRLIRCTVPTATPNRVAILRTPSCTTRRLQGLVDSLSQLRRYRGAAQGPSRTLALPESANRQRATMQTSQGIDATHGGELFPVSECVSCQRESAGP